ncbi:hypothetical protein MKL09_00930 [Methylobacterium sp. J-048]|uniref:hypothetical protein n=1 Tax=Methylobacterium sp. J-048 TaxID=2836635 RepID=UPI001FB89C92|nr:hypothetical protein [Methylobacterium sp. J-048]MCJ2055116.1 hypothetical protein [Methylobacterium sp. J-048]
MPLKTTPRVRPGISEVDAAVGTLTALVLAIERTPSAPKAVDHRSAIRRQGRVLAALGGPDMMEAGLQKIAELSPAYAEARRAIIAAEWARTSASIR